MYFSGMSESTLLLCNKTIKIDELIQKCHATDKKLKVSEKKNRQLTKKNEAKIKELVELQTNYESVQNHLFTAIQKCTDTQKALEKVQQQYKKCQEENEELTEQLETKHRKLMILEKEATLEALEKLKRKQSEDFMNKSKSKDPLYTLNIKVSTTDKEESDEMFCKNEMSFEESMLALSDKNNEKISTESNEKQHMPPPTGNPVMDNSILAPVSDENTNYPIKFTVLQLPQENNESPIVELAENYPSILIQVPAHEDLISKNSTKNLPRKMHNMKLKNKKLIVYRKNLINGMLRSIQEVDVGIKFKNQQNMVDFTKNGSSRVEKNQLFRKYYIDKLLRQLKSKVDVLVKYLRYKKYTKYEKKYSRVFLTKTSHCKKDFKSKSKTKIVEKKLEEMKDSETEDSMKWHENVQKMIFEMCELPLLSPMSSEDKNEEVVFNDASTQTDALLEIDKNHTSKQKPKNEIKCTQTERNLYSRDKLVQTTTFNKTIGTNTQPADSALLEIDKNHASKQKPKNEMKCTQTERNLYLRDKLVQTTTFNKTIGTNTPPTGSTAQNDIGTQTINPKIIVYKEIGINTNNETTHQKSKKQTNILLQTSQILLKRQKMFDMKLAMMRKKLARNKVQKSIPSNTSSCNNSESGYLSQNCCRHRLNHHEPSPCGRFSPYPGYFGTFVPNFFPHVDNQRYQCCNRIVDVVNCGNCLTNSHEFNRKQSAPKSTKKFPEANKKFNYSSKNCKRISTPLRRSKRSPTPSSCCSSKSSRSIRTYSTSSESSREETTKVLSKRLMLKMKNCFGSDTENSISEKSKNIILERRKTGNNIQTLQQSSKIPTKKNILKRKDLVKSKKLLMEKDELQLNNDIFGNSSQVVEQNIEIHESLENVKNSKEVESTLNLGVSENENSNDELEDGNLSDTSRNFVGFSANELVINESEKIILNSLQDNIKEKVTATQASKNITIPRNSNNFERNWTKTIEMETSKTVHNVEASEIKENGDKSLQNSLSKKSTEIPNIEKSNVIQNVNKSLESKIDEVESKITKIVKGTLQNNFEKKSTVPCNVKTSKMLHEESSKIDRSNIIENKIIEKNENLNDELEDILGNISDTSGNPDELSENELVINEREKVIINSLQDNVKEKATAAQAPKNLTIPRKSNNFDRKSTKVVQLETLKILDNVDASKIIENKIRDVTSIENSNIVSNSKEKVLLIENTETGGDLTKNIQEETMDIWENSSNDSLVIDLGEHENDEASTNSIESSNIVGNTPENENVRATFNVKSLEIEDSPKKLLQSNTDEKTKENSNIQELQKVENSEKSYDVIEDSTENINLKVLNVEKSKKRLQNDTQDGTIENCNVGTSKTTNKAKKSVQNNVDVKICPVKNVENLEKADKNVQIDNKSEAKKLIRSKTSLQTIIDSKIIEGFYTEIGLRNRKVKITPPSQIQIKKRKLNNSEPKKIQELETSKNNLPNINVISKERAIALMKSKISKPTTQSIVIRNPKTKEVIKLQEQIDRPNLIEERSKIEQQTEKTYRRRGRKRKCPDQDIHKKDLENNLGIFPIPSKNVRIENVESINHEVQNSSNERNKGICSIQGENFRGENNHDLDNILIENNQKIYPIPSDNSQGINSNKEYTRVENGLDVQNNQRIKSDIQSENIRVENQPDIQTLNIQVENNQNLKEMVDIPIKNSLGAGKIEILENITIIPENGNEIMNQTEKFGNNKQTDNTVVFIENCENDSRIIPEYGDLEIDFTEGIEVDFTENQKTKEAIKLHQQIDRANLIEEQTDRSKNEKKQQNRKKCRRRGRKRKCPDQDIHKKDFENNVGILPISSKNILIKKVESVNHDIRNISNECNQGISSIQGENFRSEHNHDLDNILIENNQKIYPIPSDNGQNTQGIKSDTQSENIRVEHQPDIQTVNIQVGNNQNLKEMLDIPIGNSLGAEKIKILENITIEPENGNKIMNQTKKFENNEQTDNTIVFSENDSRTIPEYGDLEIDFTEGIEVDFTKNPKTKEVIKLQEQIDRANLIEEQTDRSKIKKQNGKKWRRRGRKRKCPDQDIHKKDLENNLGIFPIPSKNILIKNVESVNHDIRNISNECNKGICSIQDENFRGENNHDLDNILIENNQKIYPIPSDNSQNTQGVKSDTQSENIRVENQPNIQTINIQVGNNQNLKEMVDIPIENSLRAGKIEILENITIEPENGNEMNQTEKFGNNEQIDNTLDFIENCENDSRVILEYGDLELDFVEEIVIENTEKLNENKVVTSKVKHEVPKNNVIENCENDSRKISQYGDLEIDFTQDISIGLIPGKSKKPVVNTSKNSIKILRKYLKDDFTEDILVTTANQLNNLEPSKIADLILEEIIEDVCEKLNFEESPPAIPLTKIQQRLITLIYYLHDRENIPDFLNVMLSKLHKYLLDKFAPLFGLVRVIKMYISFCKLGNSFDKMRDLIWQIALVHQIKLPRLMYEILTNWPEVMPIYNEDKRNILIEVVFYTLLWDTSSIYGSYKKPLIDFIEGFYNYKRGKVIMMTLANDLLKEFKSNYSSNEPVTAILIFCKHHKGLDVYKFIIKNLLQNIKTCTQYFKSNKQCDMNVQNLAQRTVKLISQIDDVMVDQWDFTSEIVDCLLELIRACDGILCGQELDLKFFLKNFKNKDSANLNSKIVS